MSLENVSKFETLLQQSAELQDKLKAAYISFKGNKRDDREVFEALIAPLAEEAGLPYTYDEGVEVHMSGQELSDDELQAVAGGDGFCYLPAICPTTGIGQDVCHSFGTENNCPVVGEIIIKG